MLKNHIIYKKLLCYFKDCIFNRANSVSVVSLLLDDLSALQFTVIKFCRLKLLTGFFLNSRENKMIIISNRFGLPVI